MIIDDGQLTETFNKAYLLHRKFGRCGAKKTELSTDFVSNNAKNCKPILLKFASKMIIYVSRSYEDVYKFKCFDFIK